MSESINIVFCVCTMLTITLQGSQCEVTVKMKSKVALENTTETFSCSGNGDVTLTIKNMDNGNTERLVAWDQIPTDFPDDQINITGTVDQENIRTIDITIFTKANNNNTLFICKFFVMTKDETSATLYIAKDTLGEVQEFQKPSLSFSGNRTVLVVSWSPPWSHIVNSYTVTMNNKTNNEWTDYEANETQWSINVEQAYSECHDLVFFVTAFTDVGIAKSNVITAGFPTGLGTPVDSKNVSVILLQKQSGTFKTEISFQSPAFCSNFQQILYNYSLYDNDHPYDTVHTGPLSRPMLESEGFIENYGNYRIEISYWDTRVPSEIISLTKYFYTNYSLPPTEMTATETTATEMTAAETSAINNTSTTDQTDACADTNNATDYTMVYIMASVGGVLIIILIIILIVFIFVVIILLSKLRAKRVQHITDATEELTRARNVTTFAKTSTIKPVKRDRKSSLPPIMATNPIYERTSSPQPLYSYLPEDIMEVRRTSAVRRPDISLEIPPHLPPPRKMSLDSPGIKNGVQLSLDKHPFLQMESTDSNDQYVSMGSVGCELRYTKSPLLKSKMNTSNDMKLKMDSKDSNNNHNNNEECFKT